MAIIQWSEKYSVGISQIDDQHRSLINSLNLLHDAMKQGKGKDVIDEILNFLANYTVEHFNTEEKLMTTYKYPGYLVHKKEHDDLVAKVKDYKQKLKEGKVIISSEILQFLSDWLNNHILKNDMAYKDFFLEKGVK